MNRLDEFLKELSELTKKYELEIGGCGCCGSPWINDLKKEGCDVERLFYDDKKQKYKLRGYKDEFEDDEDDEDEDDPVYKAFCKQYPDAAETWKMVKR